ncbi:MAG: ATP-dependent DNA helicase [Elusimicrobiota bacterium]
MEPKIKNFLLELNPEQKKAVVHNRDPLLIVAGAGTGKTTVIANRIAYLISKKKAKPEEILALTFTEKAAAEMQERVDMLVPYGFADVWISTFHSFGNRILEDESIFLGLTSDFKVMAQPQQIVFFREHLFEFPMEKLRPLGNPQKHIDALLFLFSRLKDEDISYEEYANYVHRRESIVKKEPKNRELADEISIQKEISEIYRKYEELKMHYGLIDFSDQVWMVLKLFRVYPSILEKYRKKFKYILVDEFQDTNYSQFQLLKILLNRGKNITVVGDDDQSIYKFRGAAISNILNFKKEYPTAKQIVLTKNYRSRQQILDFAYTMIKYNNPDRLEVKNKINKKLISDREHQPSNFARFAARRACGENITTSERIFSSSEHQNAVRHHHFDTVSAESDFVAEKISELHQNVVGFQPENAVDFTSECPSYSLSYKDFAILVRSNNDALPFIKSLNVQNIPWHFSGGSGLYEREEIKILISFLKVVSDLSDNVSLFHLASSEIYGMPMDDLTILLNESSRKKISLYNVFNSVTADLRKSDAENTCPTDLVRRVSEEGKKIIIRITNDIKKYMELSRELSTGQVIYKFINDTGWLKKLIGQDSRNVGMVSNIALFFEIVKNYSEIGKVDKLQFFTSHLSALIEAGSNPATAEVDLWDTDAVNILTIHKAKGLEFPVVFMVSLVQDKFPVRRRKERIEIPDSLIKDILPSGDFHIQEERRLFYVGMTRAKDKLYLTSASDYGGARERKISQFIYEALNLASTKIAAKKLLPIEAIRKNEVVKSSLTVFSPQARLDAKRANLLGKNPVQRQLTLSHFQIDDYLTCPLKYKYIHILKIPVMANHSIIYGNAMHETIQFYYKRKIGNKPVNLSELLVKFESNWQSSGFLSREHEEMRLEEGRETIRKFFHREQKSKTVPKYIEKKFKFTLRHGGFPIGDDFVTGRFDRVDLTNQGAVIIDFKTSDIAEKDEADDRAKKSTQLAIYSLAWEKITGKLPKKVELHFVNTGVVGSVVPDDKMIEKIEEIIKKVSQGIKDENFIAVPQYLSCNYCPFNNICSGCM